MKENKIVDFKAFKNKKETKENTPKHLEDVDVQAIREELRSKLREEKRKELLSKYED